MLIGKDTVVSFDYTLTDGQGQVLDSSDGRHPMSYLHGCGNIIPGLERALEGKTTGDSLKVNVAARDAYGLRQDELVVEVPRAQFKSGDISPGMRFQAMDHAGQVRIVTVTQVSAEAVTVDANHPLAGQDLNFDVNIREVRAATAEELSQGQPHHACCGRHQHGEEGCCEEHEHGHGHTCQHEGGSGCGHGA